MEKAGSSGEGSPSLFSEEELKGLSGLNTGDDFVEVTCGCTSSRLGDAVGRLKVFASGELRVICECTIGCDEDKLTPAAFEKHSGKESAGRWKRTVWVIINGKKVSLLKTSLLKYYYQASKAVNGSHKGHKARTCHRDEFIRCTACKKERRFRLHTKDECRSYHDALANPNWKCSDRSSDKASCNDEEERASRRVLRGCVKSPTCKGCTTCVCFGCDMCRYVDCNCRTCVDFTRNAAN